MYLIGKSNIHKDKTVCWNTFVFKVVLNSFFSNQIHSSWWLQVVELMAHLLKNHHQHPPAAAHTAHFAETPSNCGPP